MQSYKLFGPPRLSGGFLDTQNPWKTKGLNGADRETTLRFA